MGPGRTIKIPAGMQLEQEKAVGVRRILRQLGHEEAPMHGKQAHAGEQDQSLGQNASAYNKRSSGSKASPRFIYLYSCGL